MLAVVVLNSADADQKLTMPFPAQGRWTDLLGEFGGSPWKVAVTGAHADVPVGSHWVGCCITSVEQPGRSRGGRRRRPAEGGGACRSAVPVEAHGARGAGRRGGPVGLQSAHLPSVHRRVVEVRWPTRRALPVASQGRRPIRKRQRT